MSTSILGWKPELISPLAFAEEDVQFFSESEESNNDSENGSFCSLTRSQIAQQLLHDIDSIVKQEDDAFSNWFEQKVDLPIFDEIQAVLPAEEPSPGVQEEVEQEECEEEYEAEGETVSSADLTPPLSPHSADGSSSFLILDFDSWRTNEYHPEVSAANGDVTGLALAPEEENYILPPESCRGGEEASAAAATVHFEEMNFPTAPPTPVRDLEREMAVVDEVVRSTARQLENSWENVWESETSNSPEESDDPEWVPFGGKAPGKPRHGKPARKPYSLDGNPQDRWLRKKEQNKNAATRYRQKKKAEVSEIMEEERALEEKRAKLNERVADIRTEIKYLKGLMRDLFRAKGLITN